MRKSVNLLGEGPTPLLKSKPKFKLKSSSFDRSIRLNSSSLGHRDSVNTGGRAVDSKSSLDMYTRPDKHDSEQVGREYLAHSDSNICELLEIGNEISASPRRDFSIHGLSKLEPSSPGLVKQPNKHSSKNDVRIKVQVLKSSSNTGKDRKIQSAAVPLTKKVTSRLTQEETDPLDFYEMGKLASAEMQIRHASMNLLTNKGIMLTKNTPNLQTEGFNTSTAGREPHLGKVPWKNKTSQDAHTFSPVRSQEYKLLMVEGHSRVSVPILRFTELNSPKSTDVDKDLSKMAHRPEESMDTSNTMKASKGCFLFGKKKAPAKQEANKPEKQPKDSLSYNIFTKQTPEALESQITKILQKDDSNLKNIYFMGMLRKLCRFQRGDSPNLNKSVNPQTTQQSEGQAAMFGVQGWKSTAERTSPAKRVLLPSKAPSRGRSPGQRSADETGILWNKDDRFGTRSVAYLKEIAAKQSWAKQSHEKKVTGSNQMLNIPVQSKVPGETSQLRSTNKFAFGGSLTQAGFGSTSKSSKRRIKIAESESFGKLPKQAHRSVPIYPS